MKIAPQPVGAGWGKLRNILSLSFPNFTTRKKPLKNQIPGSPFLSHNDVYVKF
jgi:hypothetical protein